MATNETRDDQSSADIGPPHSRRRYDWDAQQPSRQMEVALSLVLGLLLGVYGVLLTIPICGLPSIAYSILSLVLALVALCLGAGPVTGEKGTRSWPMWVGIVISMTSLVMASASFIGPSAHKLGWVDKPFAQCAPAEKPSA